MNEDKLSVTTDSHGNRESSTLSVVRMLNVGISEMIQIITYCRRDLLSLLAFLISFFSKI